MPKASSQPRQKDLKSGECTSDEIYERIYLALLEHRLTPGTKLAEERLATIFNASRARVREALSKLAYEQIVEVYPKKGWFVAKPSVEQARDVFEARRVIEPAVMRRLALGMDSEKLSVLQTHLAKEMSARQSEDKRAIIRLSGEFHNLAATLAGNSSFTRSLRELSTLTCLVILVYDAPVVASCRADEHERIVRALAEKDGETAAKIMLEHLDHIEHALKLDAAEEEADLEAIFTILS
ncbi:GntR family transcriptional regulator [Burkholderia multivorans]|uniref:GntR family transcriptional regulator n=1 Tax=Burkholderia multivorans TaxID=87883 RepID=UPI000CFF13BA|nr:GntR family transcriptional regulator [Burkholderia multivorans]MDN7954005.1 GntR family transcriptional regulator [Burkholderia multivorans]PRG67559.1 GntR family transcriptional regulator [Burkholderia multivorans]